MARSPIWNCPKACARSAASIQVPAWSTAACSARSPRCCPAAKVGAASDGGDAGVSIGGYHADRSPFIYVDFTCCAWGGRPFGDGLDGNSNIYANMASQPIEVTETEQPLQITGSPAEFYHRRDGTG